MTNDLIMEMVVDTSIGDIHHMQNELLLFCSKDVWYIEPTKGK